jgi:hypothetical protein
MSSDQTMADIEETAEEHRAAADTITGTSIITINWSVTSPDPARIIAGVTGYVDAVVADVAHDFGVINRAFDGQSLEAETSADNYVRLVMP